jgi:hypothetical protein
LAVLTEEHPMLRFTTEHTGRPGAPYFTTLFTNGTTAEMADAGAVAIADFWEDIAGMITAGLVSNVHEEVDLVDPATGLITDTFTSESDAHTSTGNAPLPPATQGLVRLRTNTFVAGRRVLGRIFIPSLANDAQLVGEPSAAFIAAMDGATTTLLEGLAVAGDMVVYSRTHFTAAPVTGHSTWNRFAVLRSRRD